MGKQNKNKKKGKGAEKTTMKTEKKLACKQKKMLSKLCEVEISEVVQKLEAEQARLTVVTEEICSHPSPRTNFSFITHPEKEELILFGGEFFNGSNVYIYNDLFFYNIGKNVWKKVLSPSGPAPRSGHQMVSVATDGGQLWLFGGEYASPSQSQFYHFKDLWMMNLKSRRWFKINASNGPSARSGHRMVTSKKCLIIFGGFHDNNQSYHYYNDLHIFSLETFLWTKFELNNSVIPPPRSGCCMAAASDGKVLIWGGYSKVPMKKGSDRGITHTDMYVLKMEKNFKYNWSKIKPGGYRLLPRGSVGYGATLNDKIYCFGGVMDIEQDEEDLKGQFGDELLVLDMKTETWRLLEARRKTSNTERNITNPSVEATTYSASTSKDGIFTITVSNQVKKPVNEVPMLSLSKPFRNNPSPRMSAGICICKGTLYLYGGVYEDSNKQYTFNDFYALDLHKLEEWKVLIPCDISAHDWVESESSDSDEESGASDTDSSPESDMDID